MARNTLQLKSNFEALDKFSFRESHIKPQIATYDSLFDTNLAPYFSRSKNKRKLASNGFQLGGSVGIAEQMAQTASLKSNFSQFAKACIVKSDDLVFAGQSAYAGDQKTP